MASRVAHPVTVAPPVELTNGLVAATQTAFDEPYPDDPAPARMNPMSDDAPSPSDALYRTPRRSIRTPKGA